MGSSRRCEDRKTPSGNLQVSAYVSGCRGLPAASSRQQKQIFWLSLHYREENSAEQRNGATCGVV